MLCYVICCVVLCYMLCYVSSMNTVQQSDNGASIRDRSEVCLFVCYVWDSHSVVHGRGLHLGVKESEA
jgi:hypothetical protein